MAGDRMARQAPLWALGLLLAVSGPAQAGAPAPVPQQGGPDTTEYQVADLGPFKFENGETIANLRVSYVTHGRLNEARDNVVLVMHAFTGDLHYADFLIGPGKPLDPEKYFIVATDFLGNSRLRQTLTTGPTNSGLAMLFPEYTVRDSVNVEHKFLSEHLGLDRIRAAIGPSWGAMKAYQLAVSYPDFVRGIVPMVGAARTSPETRALLRIVMDNIRTDPGWRGGFYDVNPMANLQSALMILLPWWLTPQYFERNAGTPEQIKDYERFWQSFWAVSFPQDARDVYYQLKGWERFDLGETPGFNGDTRAALAAIKAETLLIAISGDRLVRPSEMQFARDAIPNSRYVEIDSWAGHLAALWFDPEATARIGAEIAAFLESLDE